MRDRSAKRIGQSESELYEKKKQSNKRWFTVEEVFFRRKNSMHKHTVFFITHTRVLFHCVSCNFHRVYDL
jgi:hypothetical protein